MIELALDTRSSSRPEKFSMTPTRLSLLFRQITKRPCGVRSEPVPCVARHSEVPLPPPEFVDVDVEAGQRALILARAGWLASSLARRGWPSWTRLEI